MAAIEVVGEIKVEPEEVVPLDEEKISIVEINAQDILGGFEEETEENLQKGGDANSNLMKIEAGDVKVQPSKKTNQSDDKKIQNKAIDEINLSDYSGKISTEERVLLNYSDRLTRGQKYYQKFQEIQKRLTGGSPFNKSKVKMVQTKGVFKIMKDEYSLLPHNHYRCNHCLFVNTNKRNMFTHIRHNHKDRLVTPEIYKSSLKKLNEMSDGTRRISWIEYTPEDDDHYRCNHCLIVMQGQKETEQHIITNHRQLKWIQCPYCPYQSRHDLTSHILSVHNDKRDYRCGLCDYKSKLKSGLRRHIQNVHLGSRKKFACSECSRVFRESKTLRNHVLCIHQGGTAEKMKCFHCGREYITKEALAHHIQTRHAKLDSLETFQCQLCPFKTKFKTHFYKHSSHYHRQAKVCHMCSYTCRTGHMLNLHLMTHKGKIEDKDLKYRCDQCDYKTYRPYSFQVHQLKHKKPEEIQYFYCYHCDFKAKRKDNLKSHIFRHEKKKEIEYECYICEFKTIKKDVLVRHINKHSKEAKNDLIIVKTEVIPSRVELQDKKNIQMIERPKKTKYTIKRKSKLSNFN